IPKSEREFFRPRILKIYSIPRHLTLPPHLTPDSRRPRRSPAPRFPSPPWYFLSRNRRMTMATEQTIAANRLNAELSTGPKTEAGRKRSSLNALRHGLTGQVTAMTDEDRAAHDQLSKGLIQSLAPEGAMELQLAQRIATDSWRLNRASAIEDNIFALGQLPNGGQACPDVPQIDAALTTAHVFTQESKQLQLLTLYEQRLNRAVQKNLALLQSLQ